MGKTSVKSEDNLKYDTWMFNKVTKKYELSCDKNSKNIQIKKEDNLVQLNKKTKHTVTLNSTKKMSQTQVQKSTQGIILLTKKKSLQNNLENKTENSVQNNLNFSNQINIEQSTQNNLQQSLLQNNLQQNLLQNNLQQNLLQNNLQQNLLQNNSKQNLLQSNSKQSLLQNNMQNSTQGIIQYSTFDKIQQSTQYNENISKTNIQNTPKNIATIDLTKEPENDMLLNSTQVTLPTNFVIIPSFFIIPNCFLLTSFPIFINYK